MKKVLIVTALILLLVTALAAWVLLAPATGFKGKNKFLYILSKQADKATVLQRLEKDSIIRQIKAFDWVADKMDYWSQVKPGKYRINSDNSILNIIRLLKNGQQTPVNLVITKIRTKEDLAALVGKKFECDSASFMDFLLNYDTLINYGVDTNTVMTTVLPDTYTYFWNTTPSRIYSKLFRQYQSFWTPERKELASARGLNPQTAYTLASIVEEETNKKDEKGHIASVYLNRVRIGMRLGADPTVKYALRDFGLKRIYKKHLVVASPYNTYQVSGLPPGPICTPSSETIDSVLHSPETPYIYFVAKSDFSGYHQFTTSYKDHLAYARLYQKALDTLIRKRQENNIRRQ